jgi:hypothetical protein
MSPLEKKVARAVESGHMQKEEAQQILLNDARGVKPEVESLGERKKREAKEALQHTLRNLHSKVKESGTEYGGKKGAEMETAYGDFFMKYKTAEELGAIQGADERLVKNIIADPSAFGAQFNPMAGGNIQAQIEEYARLQGWDFTEDGEKKQPQQKKEGGQIMTDAQGNRAMVYPDGSFEEI